MTRRQTTSRKSTTKKSTSNRSTSRRSTSKSSGSTRKRTSNNQTLFILVAIVLVIGIYLIATGGDVEGLLRDVEKVSDVLTDGTPGSTSSENGSANAPVVPAGGGDWWQVYFTDPKTLNNPEAIQGSLEEKLIERINAAQTSIHIAAFEFNLTPVAEALIAAHERGVAVQWLTDDEHGLEADEEEDHGQFAMLEQAGIEVRSDDRSALMHNKFWIFDDQVLWTGSMNSTINDVFRNNNNVIIFESPELAAIYEREFQELWAGESGPTSPSDVDQQRLAIGDTPIEVYFAAEDEVVDQLLPYLEGAQTNIRFMAFSFTQDDLGNALLARAEAGVDIQGIFETRGSETEFSELGRLHCAGVPVRQDGNPQTFHHKVFVVDNQLVVTGSFNFSDGANNDNDENAIVLKNGDIAQLYLAEFDRRWAEAKELEPDEIPCN